jgi:hypothetical protein
MQSLVCAVLRGGGAGYVALMPECETDDRSKFGTRSFDGCEWLRGP